MQSTVTSVFYTLVLGGLFLSSCATNKKISGEYDDLYYSPSNKNVKQNNVLQQAQTKIETSIDASSVVLGDSLIIKRAKSKELNRMANNKEINISQMNEIKHNMRYMISTKGKILLYSEIDSILNTNNEAYLKYRNFKKEIDKSWKANKTFGIIGGLTMGITGVGALTIDDPQLADAVFHLGGAVLIVELGIVAIIAVSIDSKIKKFGTDAINIYNNGIQHKTQIPKANILFGKIGNGIGMKVNF